MENIIFTLTGIGDASLESKINFEILNHNYSDNELRDIKIPEEYNISDYISNLDDLNNRLKYLKDLLLITNINLPKENNIIKTLIKKLFGWYFNQFYYAQYEYNIEVLSIFNDILSYINNQKNNNKE